MNANIMICKDNCVGNLYLNVFCQVPSSSGSRACIKVTVNTRAISKGKMLTLPSQLEKSVLQEQSLFKRSSLSTRENETLQ